MGENQVAASARWERVKELFEAALARNESGREQFLAEACGGDNALRKEVEALLSGHQKAAGFLSASPVAASVFPQPDPVPAFSPQEIVANRFQIVRLIGKGGMGQVFEAVDLELKARIALKTIRAAIAGDPVTLARFKKEILLSRKVTHPNVCRVYDLERCSRSVNSTIEDVTFLTMEFLEGETLADRLRRQGPMSREQALPLIRQMVYGLEAAHAAGVIHRDFKPSNVMLIAASGSSDPAARLSQQQTASISQPPPFIAITPENTRVVITDFGLAKAVLPEVDADSNPAEVTLPGQLVGTPAYMAPEQLTHGRLTPATDVYALGLVMREMVAGRAGNARGGPLLSSPAGALPYQRKQTTPADMAWISTITRCLATDPEARFQSVSQVLESLQSDTAGTTALPRPLSADAGAAFRAGSRTLKMAALALGLTLLGALAIIFGPALIRKSHSTGVPTGRNLVVLPFTALGGNGEEQILCDGFTSTVTAKLAAFPALSVPSAQDVRDKHVQSVKQARTQLGANLVLEATWQQQGALVRINLSLVDASTYRQLRTRTLDAQIQNLFALQDQVVTAVSHLLGIGAPQSAAGAAQALPIRPAAYDYYLRGRGYLRDYDRLEKIQNAIKVFDYALQIEPNYAPALAGLGQAYWYEYKLTSDVQWVAKAQTECRDSIRADARLAAGYACLGAVENGKGDYPAAVTHFQKATELDGTYDEAFTGLAAAYENLGKLDEAERTYQRAISIRPNYWAWYNWLGGFYAAHNRLPEAEQMFSQVVRLAPDSSTGYSNLGAVQLYEGRYDQAEAAFKQSLSIRPTADAYSNLASAYFYRRNFSADAAALEQAIKLNDGNYQYWGNLGLAYFWMPGRKPEADNAFRKALELAQVSLKVNPRNASLLGDMAGFYSMLHQKPQALSLLNRALALEPSSNTILFDAALVYNQFGQTPLVLRYLRKAIQAGLPLDMVRNSPDLDALHSNPVYKEMVPDK